MKSPEQPIRASTPVASQPSPACDELKRRECCVTLAIILERLKSKQASDETEEIRENVLRKFAEGGNKDALFWDFQKLSPLLTALDGAIEVLQTELDDEKRKIPALTARCEAVVRENESLRHQLEESQFCGASHPSISDASEELAAKLLRQQNSQLRRALQEARAEANAQSARAAQLSQAHQATQAKLAKASSTAESDKKECETAKRQLEVLRTRSESYASRAKSAEAEVTRLRREAAASASRAKQMASRAAQALGECQGVVARQRLLAAALSERQELVRSVSMCVKAQSVIAHAMAAGVNQCEASECDAEKRSILQHELAIERAARADAEFEANKLRETLEDVLANSISKHDYEAAVTAREQREKESDARAMACAEEAASMRVRADRALREASCIANELERVRAAAAADATRAGVAYEACAARYRSEEKLRLELTQQLSTATSRHEADMGNWGQERQHLEDEKRHLEKLQKRADAALAELRVELRGLAAKLAAAQRSEHEAVLQVDELRRQLSTAESSVVRKHDARVRDLESTIADLQRRLGPVRQ